MRNRPGLTCVFAGCKPRADDPPRRYRGEGTYCGRHARMTIHPARWQRLGVPVKDAQPPGRRPARPSSPALRTLGWAPLVDPVEVICGPCPARGCGRPAWGLPGEELPPCLACELAAGSQPGAGPCALPLDPVLTALGYATHPCCDPGEQPSTQEER